MKIKIEKYEGKHVLTVVIYEITSQYTWFPNVEPIETAIRIFYLNFDYKIQRHGHRLPDYFKRRLMAAAKRKGLHEVKTGINYSDGK